MVSMLFSHRHSRPPKSVCYVHIFKCYGWTFKLLCVWYIFIHCQVLDIIILLITLHGDHLRVIGYKCLQDLFVIKANVHNLRDNNKMKLYKFKTMTYDKHSIKYVAGILWNSINVDIKNTDNVIFFKEKWGSGKVPLANVVSA